MIWSIDFAPFLPMWLIVGLALAGAALIGLAVKRRIAVIWFRAVALAALTIALANPLIMVEDREPLPTTVALVVDQSASQSLENRSDTTDAARAVLAERLGALEGVEQRLITAGEGNSTNNGTALFAAIEAGLADVPPDRVGAIIMITDGQVHDAPETTAGFGGAPIHALITGRADEIDRRIEIEAAPRFGIVDEPQEIAYRIIDDGAGDGAAVAVSIYRDGALIAVERAIAGASRTFRFTVPHGGGIMFEFVAEPLGGELTELNNSAVVALDGIRENLRVLLVSGEPHAGERTWRDLLKSDASVDLIHFTILRPPEKIDITPQNELALIAFPTRELFSETLYDFDLIIFDRYQLQGALPLAYFDNIAGYVAAGGALLIAAGPDDAGPFSIYRTGLASILPVRPTGSVIETPYYPTVTDPGFRHPVTRDLPGARSDPPDWSRWFRLIEAENPVGDVVMEGPDGLPLLVLGHQGDGRVAMLLSDHAWLWARDFEGGGPYLVLLRRIAHWLMREPDLDEEALRATSDGANLTIERQTMANLVDPVLLSSPLGIEQELALVEIEPGLWRATIAVDDIGLWRAEDGGRVAVVHIGPANPREYRDPRSTETVLAPVVDAANGHISRISDAGDVPRVIKVGGGSNYGGGDWLGVRMTDASVLLGIDRFQLFAGFLGLALLAGLLAMTWFREGR